MEEEYVVDAEGNGSWQPATQKSAPTGGAGRPTTSGGGSVVEGTPEPGGGAGSGKPTPKRSKKAKPTPTLPPDVSVSRESI